MFLIDENLPKSIGVIFERLGFRVEYVRENLKLNGQTDEIIFRYAINKKAIIVTRDLDFVDLLRFDIHKLAGIVIIRFPQEISIATIYREITKATKNFHTNDFRKFVMVIEPGLVRKRKIK